MSRFYDLFEQISRDIYQGFIPLIRDRIPRDVPPEFVDVEMECRYINATNEKYRGMIERIVRDRRDFTRTLDRRETRDEVYEGGVRRSYPPGVGTYPEDMVKIKIFFRRGSPLARAVDFFRTMGLKISFSLEIKDRKYFDRAFRRVQGDPPLIRKKTRTSLQFLPLDISLDMTTVTENNRYKFEVEADKTVPLVKFLEGDSQGMIKDFLFGADLLARDIIHQSRTPLPAPALEYGLSQINRALGFEKRDDRPTFRIEKLVPQVRNLTITDLLKEGYSGYAVTPKADGYRYFLVILRDFIFMVQPPNIYKVVYEGSRIPPEWVGFIFDGELVERENWKMENVSQRFYDTVDYFYCIFDVLGYPSSGFPLTEQGDILRRINRLKTYFEEVRRTPGTGLFGWDSVMELITLSSEPNTRLKSLTTAIQIKPYDDASSSPWLASDAFFDTLRDKLPYHDDGLIFTPLETSFPGLNDTMSLKWKPLDMLSIDFQYREGGDLLVYTDSGLVPFTGTSLFPLPPGKPKLSNVTETLVDGRIYEFVYEPERLEFRFTRSRPDKGIPNKLSNASQVWTDVHIPLSSDVIRGRGNAGMKECLKEGLWSWISKLHSYPPMGKLSIMVDLTDMDPLRDFPIRAFNEGFQSLFSDVVVYREDVTRKKIDFPRVANLPTGELETHVDVLVLDGVLFSILEGRPLTYHPQPERAKELFDLMIRILPHVRYVFVRGLCSVEEEIFFVPEMQHDQEHELVLRMIEEKVIEIEYKPGGIFPYSNTKMVAYPRTISQTFPCVSAGHRITEQFVDNGPENILTNPRQGRIWDFYFNSLMDGRFVEGLVNKPGIPAPSDATPLEDIFAELRIEDDAPMQPPSSPISEGRPSSTALRSLLSTREVSMELLEPIIFDPSTNKQPTSGHLLEMISKLVLSLRSTYDVLLVERSYREIQALLPPTLTTEQIVEELFHKLGLGVLLFRRTSPGTSLNSFRVRFIDPSLGTPKYGFVLVESLPGSLDPTSSCRLLSYHGSSLIHPSDPLIPLLYDLPLTTIILEKETKLSPSRLSKTKFETMGEEKTWPTIHRLFLSYPYLQTPRNDSIYGYVKEYVEYIRTESTDNKATYLITMTIPKRFQKQSWAKELQTKIDWARSKGIKPLDYSEGTEEHIRNFMKMITITDKALRELSGTGNAFLFDGTLPGNVYGSAYMNLRSN